MTNPYYCKDFRMQISLIFWTMIYCNSFFKVSYAVDIYNWFNKKKLPLNFNLSVGNVGGIALLCFLCPEQLVYATGTTHAINQVLKSRRAILWSGAITPVMSLFKYNIFVFWAYNVKTYWTIVLNAFLEPWLMHFTKGLIMHVFKTELWIYFWTEYVNNIFPLLYVGVKFGLSNWENCVDSGAIQISCLSLRSHRNTSFS
jgi:hypothetical protein